MPVDGLVKLHHALLAGRVFDKPAVERIVEDGLVCAPAMGIVVYMLFALEGLALLLQLVAKHDVEVFGLVACRLVPHAVLVKLGVVCVLYIVAGMVAIEVFVDACGNETAVEVVEHIELALKVNHRTGLALLVYKVESGDVGILCHLGIVSTKGRSDVNDTCTVVGCDIVAENYAERFILHLHKLVAAVF